MSTLLAIDPGNDMSGWCVIDVPSRRPLAFGKTNNADLRVQLGGLDVDRAVIEMIASYGMPVGAEVFVTCIWIGRFSEALLRRWGRLPDLVTRQAIKLHHCHSNKANDATIRQALVDRFAYGQPNHGKGTKAAPGWFHGFAADVWQSYALAVYCADTMAGGVA